VTPVFDTVARGGGQALLLDAPPGSPVTLTVAAPYPAAAILFDDSSLGSPDGFGTPLRGTRVAGSYRYTLPVGASGLALLAFAIPDTARQGTVATRVTAQESCGQFKTVVTFEVRGTVRASVGAAPLRIALPQGATLPRSIDRLVRHGLARGVTQGRGAGAPRVLVLTDHAYRAPQRPAATAGAHAAARHRATAARSTATAVPLGSGLRFRIAIERR